MDDINLYKSDAKLAARLGISGPMLDDETLVQRVQI